MPCGSFELPRIVRTVQKTPRDRLATAARLCFFMLLFFDSALVEQHGRAVEALDAVHHEIGDLACQRDHVLSAAAHVLHRDVVGLVGGGVARAVHVRIADADGVESAIHVCRALRRVVNSVNENIVQLRAALIEQSDVGAIGLGPHVLYFHVANVRRHTLDGKVTLKTAVKRSQRYRIVLGEACDIFNGDMVASAAQVDAVGVLDENVRVAFAAQSAILPSLGVDGDVRGTEINIAEIAVGRPDEVQRQPALVAAANSRNPEALNVGEEDEIVLPDRRQAVFALRPLGETVVFSAVEDRLAAADDVDIVISARYRASEIGVVMLVDEHI